MCEKLVTSSVFVVCILVASSHTVALNARSQEGGEMLNTLLAEGVYDKNMRPRDNGNEVKVNMYVRDMDIVDKARGELHLQVDLRQTWNDPRLAYNRSHPGVTSLKTRDATAIWNPQLFVVNNMNAYNSPKDETWLVADISPNGDVVFIQRLSLKLICPMDFQRFPFDSSNFSAKISSYTYNEETLRLDWDTEPVKMDEMLPNITGNFEFWRHNSTRCNATAGLLSENCSCIEATFTFDRRVDLRFKLVISAYLIVWFNNFPAWFMPMMNISERLCVNLASFALMFLLLLFGGVQVVYTVFDFTAWNLIGNLSVVVLAYQLSATLYFPSPKPEPDTKSCSRSFRKIIISVPGAYTFLLMMSSVLVEIFFPRV